MTNYGMNLRDQASAAPAQAIRDVDEKFRLASIRSSNTQAGTLAGLHISAAEHHNSQLSTCLGVCNVLGCAAMGYRPVTHPRTPLSITLPHAPHAGAGGAVGKR